MSQLLFYHHPKLPPPDKFAHINLKVYYLPPYKRLVWDYKKAETDAINLAIKSFNCENAFNGKYINSQVELFNKNLMNIFSIFILNKIKTFRDSDPPWMNDDIKSKVKLKHRLYDFTTVTQGFKGITKILPSWKISAMKYII